jgi:hypothetical protein
MTIFQKIFDKELIEELIVAQMNLYAQQAVYSSVQQDFGAQSRVRKWEDVTTDKLYMVNALFRLMRIIQKPTL